MSLPCSCAGSCWMDPAVSTSAIQLLVIPSGRGHDGAVAASGCMTAMSFDGSPELRAKRDALIAFVEEQVRPAEEEYFGFLATAPSRWTVPPVMESLKAKAKAAGLWNLFLPDPG